MTAQPERCLIDEAHRITGLPKRNLQYLALQGRIPGASRLGSRWTFDRATLRRWAREGDHKPCQKTPIVEAPTEPGGPGSRSTASSIAEAFERMYGLKPSRGETPSSRR